MNSHVEQLKSNIEPVRSTLLAHPVYSQIQDLQGLQRFSEIHVLGEESDVDQDGVRISHFELYIKAMQQMGASTFVIEALIAKINAGVAVQDAIEAAELPKKVKDFLQFTFDISFNAPLHVRAAVFTFGREDLIPSMFMKILDKIYADAPHKVSIFKYYIERHIEVDGDHHSHLALDMVSRLCGDDASKWEEATSASVKALALRIGLWDAIFDK